MPDWMRWRKVVEANPIAEVVGEYLPMRPDEDGFRGLCPFHGEHDQSFRIEPAGGDASIAPPAVSRGMSLTSSGCTRPSTPPKPLICWRLGADRDRVLAPAVGQNRVPDVGMKVAGQSRLRRKWPRSSAPGSTLEH